jgi:hypothetical protein
MIKNEGRMQVEITGAWWETVETKDGEVDIAKLTIKDTHDNTDEMSLWLSDRIERGGKYKDHPQYVAVIERLTEAGMTDGDPKNIGDIVGSEITISSVIPDGKEYCSFYWQDGAKVADSNEVADRLKKMRGTTQAMAGTPVDAKPVKDDDDNLPF